MPAQSAGYMDYEATNFTWAAADCDGDGTANGIEVIAGTDPYVADMGNDTDMDGDGIIDSADSAPNDPCVPAQSPGYTDYDGTNFTWAAADCDGDGTANGIEVFLGTDPYGDAPTTDTDGDGVADDQDQDSDNDGIPDAVEQGTATNGGDTDGDGIPDELDLDSDNDGINDVIEAGGVDTNGDGQQDGQVDPMTGQIGNGLTPPDTDGDGQPDTQDLDSDNDSVSDLEEGGTGALDTNNDGTADGPDSDGDGIVDSADGDDDNFGDSGDMGAIDTDGEGTPDYIDPDNDDPDDNTVGDTDGNGDDIDDTPNAGADANNDGEIDDPTDSDMDGVADAVDSNNSQFGGIGQGSTACISINTAVWLEGAYENGRMRTTLNELGYLPGQRPSTLLGIATTAGQPYNVAPWNYDGQEGADMDFMSPSVPDNANYASTVVDWVLVSLRTGLNRATTVCTRAALLHSDGQVEFLAGFDCCDINTNQSYYIVIEHRNHLIVMSDTAVPIEGNSLSYDFRTQNSYESLLSTGQKEIVSGIYAMFAGNNFQEAGDAGNHILNIITRDKSEWLGELGQHSSYFSGDLDLNGDVNVNDKPLWLENDGIFSGVPWEN